MTRSRLGTACLALAVLAGGCAKEPAPARERQAQHDTPAAEHAPESGATPGSSAEVTAPALPPRPATYAGELPCADCPGIVTTLTLLPEGTYRMRRVYRDATAAGDATFVEPGAWSLEANGHTLVLQSGPESTQRFAITDPHTLDLLDHEGMPIASQANHTLRHAALDPIEDSFPMHGLFIYMADAGRFRECLSGNEVAVAQEADNAALERAYTQLASGPGLPVLVSLVGHFSARPRPDGEGQQPALVVDRFLTAIRAAAECGPIPDAPLENTYWKVLEVNGAPMPVFDEQREAHLRFTGEGKLAGRGPCNTLMGGYTLAAADSLRFSGVATTRMACPVGMDEEAGLLAALQDAAAYRVRGERLELLAPDGRTLVRLIAVYF